MRGWTEIESEAKAELGKLLEHAEPAVREAAHTVGVKLVELRKLYEDDERPA